MLNRNASLNRKNALDLQREFKVFKKVVTMSRAVHCYHQASSDPCEIMSVACFGK